MPIISRFYGIIIYIFWKDHAPPHLHAKYADDEIIVEIESGLIIGSMSKRAIKMVQEWREIYKSELLQDWKLAEQKRALFPIKPLE